MLKQTKDKFKVKGASINGTYTRPQEHNSDTAHPLLLLLQASQLPAHTGAKRVRSFSCLATNTVKCSDQNRRVPFQVPHAPSTAKNSNKPGFISSAVMYCQQQSGLPDCLFLKPNSRNLAFLKCGWRHNIHLHFWLFRGFFICENYLHENYILFINNFPLTLKRPPQVSGRRRPPGVKCDPTMKMVITNAGFQSFQCQIKIHVY